MDITEVIKLIVDNGVTIAILAYFCVRDWKFMNTLVETLATLSSTVTTIKDMIEKEDD